MTYTSGLLLLVAAIAVIIGAVLQLLQYRRGRHIITRGQLALRLLAAALIVSIIGMIFFGSVYPWPNPLVELLFWSVLTLLAMAVIFVAMADLRMLERQRHLRQAELYRAIQEMQDKASQESNE